MCRIAQMPPDRLGRHFTEAEFLRTSRPIENVWEAPQHKLNAKLLVQTVLDPLRDHLGRPLRITSGYRCDAVNRAVGGSAHSLHRYGKAADMKTAGLDSHGLMLAVVQSDVPFDQCIAYAPERGGHVHIQVKAGSPGRNRRQKLWAPAGGGYESYEGKFGLMR